MQQEELINCCCMLAVHARKAYAMHVILHDLHFQAEVRSVCTLVFKLASDACASWCCGLPVVAVAASLHPSAIASAAC
jgi:hypothetical protein